MGVYINGMEVPTTCGNCPVHKLWAEDDEAQCMIVRTLWTKYSERNPDCPLVPVPPHGDLIDREPFVEFIKTHWDSYDQWFVDQLEARPTVIPADPAEEGE